MSEKEVLNLSSDDLENVSGGVSQELAPGGIVSPIVGGEGGIWKPVCPSCGKVMPGGEGVIRISTNIGNDVNGTKNEGSPYYCTECAEKLLNTGKAVIEPGYEGHYEKYNKSMNETTGEIWHGWRAKNQ